MKTKITKRGQTVIPSRIRERYHVKAGDHVEWIDQGEAIKVIPIPANPLKALRGCAHGEKLLDLLLSDRREEQARES